MSLTATFGMVDMEGYGALQFFSAKKDWPLTMFNIAGNSARSRRTRQNNPAALNHDRRPYLLRAAVAHVESYIENDQQADIGYPAVLLQQVRDEVSGKAHQGNG